MRKLTTKWITIRNRPIAVRMQRRTHTRRGGDEGKMKGKGGK